MQAMKLRCGRTLRRGYTKLQAVVFEWSKCKDCLISAFQECPDLQLGISYKRALSVYPVSFGLGQLNRSLLLIS